MSSPTAIYTAARFGTYAQVRWFNEAIRKTGDIVTHDWTLGDEFGPDGHPLVYDPDHPQPVQNGHIHAQRDLDGIDRCSLFVCLAHEILTGAWIEFGYALAKRKDMVLVAPHRYTVFHDLPQVLIFDSFEDLPWVQGRSWSQYLLDITPA